MEVDSLNASGNLEFIDKKLSMCGLSAPNITWIPRKVSTMVSSSFLSENKEIIQRLKNIPVLGSFSDQDLDELLKQSRVIKYEPGERIIEEGHFDKWIFFLFSGKVGIQKQGETIAVLKRRGDLFGEMGVIDGSPRSASIVAIEESVCMAVDTSAIESLRGEERNAFSGILYRIFSEILANRLRFTDQELVKTRDENALLKAELNKLKKQKNDDPFD
jgi:CRP-like cAMP-binding protein